MKKRLNGIRFYLLIFCAGSIFPFLLLFCNRKEVQKEETQFLNLSDTVSYVGMNVCRQCHSEIYENFIRTGMGHSFGSATSEVSDADFTDINPVHDSINNLTYRAFFKNGKVGINEYRLSGKDTLHRRSQEMDFIIGSGHHTNSHLFSVNGYLFQGPLTYYTQDKIWDLPPGFENNNSRFKRKIGIECMTCHNGYPEFVKGSINKYNSIPMGIDCERCHGPGELHVKMKQEGIKADTSSGPDLTIVNPKRLPFELQNDLCQRCHLQGNAVLKNGKSFLDFKPGMRLSDVYDVFMPVFREKETVIMAAHPERLMMSPCFKGSKKENSIHQLTCITCHNPHHSVRETKREYFISSCQKCHNDEGCSLPVHERMEAGNDCIKCHMPKTGTVDIPHVRITDHNIRIIRDNDDVSGVSEDKATVTGLKCMTDPNPSQKTRVWAYLYYYEKFSSQKVFLDSAFAILKNSSLADFPEEWIYYHFLKGEESKLLEVVNKTGKVKFSSAIINYQVGQALFNTGNYSKASEYFDYAGEQMPYNLEYQMKRATTLLFLREPERAEEILNFIIRENPMIAEAQNNLGFLLLTRGRTDEAEKRIARAISLDPDYGNAYLNYAKVLLVKGKRKRAEILLDSLVVNLPAVKAEAGEIRKLLQAQP